MDPSAILIGLDIGLVLTIIYVLDRNVFHFIDLQIQNVFVICELRINQRLLGIRLWLDRQSMLHRGPIGKLWNEYCLWQIRNNPAYKEFFKEMSEMQDK
jgi:hypothetical protein